MYVEQSQMQMNSAMVKIKNKDETTYVHSSFQRVFLTFMEHHVILHNVLSIVSLLGIEKPQKLSTAFGWSTIHLYGTRRHII